MLCRKARGHAPPSPGKILILSRFSVYLILSYIVLKNYSFNFLIKSHDCSCTLDIGNHRVLVKFLKKYVTVGAI